MNQREIFQTLCQCRIDEKIFIGITGNGGKPIPAIVAKAVHLTGSCNDCVTIRMVGNGHSPQEVNIFDIWHITKEEK